MSAIQGSASPTTVQPLEEEKTVSTVNISKTSEALSEVFKNYAPIDCVDRFIGMNQNDYNSLYPTQNQSTKRIVSFGNDLFVPVVIDGLEKGSCVLTTEDFRRVKEGVHTATSNIFRVKPENFLAQEAEVQISLYPNTKLNIKNKKAFKTEILNECVKTIVRSQFAYTLSHRGCAYKLIFDKFNGNSKNKHALMDHTTRLRLRKIPGEDVKIEENVKSSPQTTFIFHLTTPHYGDIPIPKQKVLETIDKIFSLGEEIVPGKTIEMEHETKRIKAELRTVKVYSKKTYDNSYDRRTKIFKRLEDAIIQVEKDNQIKYTEEIPVPVTKAPEPASEPKPVTPNPNEIKVELTFKEFLKEEGYAGLPPDLQTQIDAILGIYGSGEMKEVADWLGIKKEKGIIFYGPPGTGKTTLAKKVLKYLKIPEDRISMVSCSELIKGKVGSFEEAVKAMFASAKKTNALCAVLMDELDAVFRDRATLDQGYMDGYVPALLAEMDGIQGVDNVLVIGCTNKLEKIDKALLRKGRFGLHIFIDNPDKEQRKCIYEIYTKSLKEKKVLNDNVNLDLISEISEGLSSADLEAIIQEAKNDCFSKMTELVRTSKTPVKVKEHLVGMITLPFLIEKITKLRESKGLVFLDALKKMIEEKIKELEEAKKKEMEKDSDLQSKLYN